MSYTKQTWVDDVTDADAAHMNHIEQGMDTIDERVDLLEIIGPTPGPTGPPGPTGATGPRG